ncbi:hypothetical protein DV735_g1748, partial [Chaetothyriales sp. CBS 134920]
MPSRLNTPVLALDVAKLKEVDPRNVESLFSLWAMFNQCSQSLQDGRRLENMSWRLWARETLCCPPQPDKAIVPQLDSSWQSQVPSLSNSIASDDEEEEEMLEDETPTEPLCRHQSHSPMSDDSALSKSRGHETHLSADTLKKIVTRIQEKTDLGPLSPSLEASLPPLKHLDAEFFATKSSTDEKTSEASCDNQLRESTNSCVSRTTVATASTNVSRPSDHRSSDTSVSSDGLIRSGSVVHGFSPASTSFRAKAMHGLPMPQPGKLAPPVAKKPNMFQLGASSEEEESSFEAKASRFGLMRTSGAPNSPSDEEKPVAAEQYQFRRVESRHNIVSRPSILSMQLEQKQRGLGMQNPNSRSQPAFQRTRTTSLNESTLATSPEDQEEEDAGLVMQNSKAKPRPITTSHINPRPAIAQAHSPRTTRRNMLASELGESLRKNLLWERQQKSQTANAFLKRSRNAQSMANLQGAAAAPPCPPQWNNRQSWNNEFENPWEFNARGW